MPVQRDSDGNIIDQPTQHISEGKTASPTHQSRESERGQSPPSTGRDNPYDARTVVAGTVKPDTAKRATGADEPQTRIHRPGRQVTKKSTQHAALDVQQTTTMDDPPVGWLVVIGGPGQGNVLTLGNGLNSIGRDDSERLTLNFGDEMISRTSHASITYDPLGKKFYIQHGGGINLTYVNDQPVLSPLELQQNTNIRIGNTMLRFIPLCGDHFDWDTQGVN